MERLRSPTSELSRGLGALRLSRSETNHAKSEGATLPDSHSDNCEQVDCVSTSFHSRTERSHHRSTAHKHCASDPCHCGCEQDDLLLNQMKTLSVSADASRDQLGDFHDHIQSNSPHLRHTETLSASSNAVANGNHAQWAWPRGGHGNGSCRDEALGVGYVDDITVEDLAGYFDQMLHLPKPMSDMAQLMYT